MADGKKVDSDLRQRIPPQQLSGEGSILDLTFYEAQQTLEKPEISDEKVPSLEANQAEAEKHDERKKSRFAPTRTSDITRYLHTHSVFVPRKARPEAWYHIHTEVAVPHLFAGTGMVIAGFLLDLYSCGAAFRKVRELTVLIIPLIGLRSSLEMIMAARLCTNVNLGMLPSNWKRFRTAINDMVVSQIQAIVVGIVAGVLAFLIVTLESQNSQFSVLDRLIYVWACSILTAVTTTSVIGSLMISTVFGASKIGINPDNVVTPTATFLGDMFTIFVLHIWTDLFFPLLDRDSDMDAFVGGAVVVTFIVVVLPILIYIACRDKDSKDILKHCWTPVLISVAFSTGAGSILESQGRRFHNMNLYQPVINGVAGNLNSIQYNRISTAYNRDSKLGELPEVKAGRKNKVFNTPIEAMFYQGQQTVSFWVLVTMVIPGQINFAILTYFLSPTHVPDCFEYFVPLYVVASLIQTMILMYITLNFTNFLWARKVQPDNYIIPIVTAIGDLIGTSLLFGICELVYTLQGCQSGLNFGKEAHTDCEEILS